MAVRMLLDAGRVRRPPLRSFDAWGVVVGRFATSGSVGSQRGGDTGSRGLRRVGRRSTAACSAPSKPRRVRSRKPARVGPGVDGRIIDVGCGPGQWTSYLSGEAWPSRVSIPWRNASTTLVGNIPASPIESVLQIGSVSGVRAWEECSLVLTDPHEPRPDRRGPDRVCAVHTTTRRSGHRLLRGNLNSCPSTTP